jgi:hypothetical protein
MKISSMVYPITPITRVTLRTLPVPKNLQELTFIQENGTGRDSKFTLFLSEAELTHLGMSLANHVNQSA